MPSDAASYLKVSTHNNIMVIIIFACFLWFVLEFCDMNTESSRKWESDFVCHSSAVTSVACEIQNENSWQRPSIKS